MSKKWYLQTWFICLLFAFWWFLFIPGILGLIFLIMQIIENHQLTKKYGKAIEIDSKINELGTTFQNKNASLISEYEDKSKKLNDEFETKSNKINQQINSLMQDVESLKAEKQSNQRELQSLEFEIICKHYDFSDYSGLTSEDCKNKLSLLKVQEQDAIKNNTFFRITSSETKKVVNDNMKQMIRCFNAECDNILLGITNKNIDSMRGKMTKSFDTLNKIFSVDGIQLEQKALEIKLEELNLVYTYELKREEELAIQKEIKAQMIEEEKVRREIEKQKAQLEKDQAQFSNEINKLMKYMQKTQDDVEKKLYIDKIRELEDRLKELEKEKENVLEREANAKAGFVYVISNIGSFGENIYKIGMTRRLEPMDRIKELSSASVPFEFDVHAMIFSKDAPDLETTLHRYFEKKSVNRVNPRKEFFRVSLDEIEKVVKENYNNTVEFTKIPVATEYRQTLSIVESETA